MRHGWISAGTGAARDGRRAYESAFRVGQVDPWTWHVTGIDEIAASCLALLHQLQNQDSEAQQLLEHALVRLPDSARLRRQLLDLHIKYDRRQMRWHNSIACLVICRTARRCARRSAADVWPASRTGRRPWVTFEPHMRPAAVIFFASLDGSDVDCARRPARRRAGGA